MNPQKPIFYSNKYERKKVVEFSMKMPAKHHSPPSKKLLQGQSSAHTSKRKPIPQPRKLEESTNISGEQHRLQHLRREQNVLSEDQIRNSLIYKMLQEEIGELLKAQEEQLGKMKEVRMWIHRQVREQKRKEVDVLDSETHGVKLQIWELRNEALELKESIEEEKNETEKLMEELGN